MQTDELDYFLPPGHIATVPAQPRDSARMLVVHADHLEHRTVADLPDYLQPCDALVMNNSAVLPARINGHRSDSGGRVSGLVLDAFFSTSPMVWKVMLKSNGKLRPQMTLQLDYSDGSPSPYALKLLSKEGREWNAQLSAQSDDVHQPLDAAEVLEQVGQTPLPPYILQSRDKSMPIADAEDREWYQTVYADLQQQRSVAAPTAGLHFTDRLLGKITAKQVDRYYITLHVGAGTFQPVDTERLEDHPMHREDFSVSQQMLCDLAKQRKAGGRLFAVGTTTVRCLESLELMSEVDHSADDICHASTNLLISPPYEFKWIDGLLTNFHLPRSTLLALVGAKVGMERLQEIYQIAIAEDYRFYSYGDAMLILP